MELNIPLSKPYLDEDDIKEVNKVLRTRFLSLGPKIKEFENEFAKYIGTKYAVAVSNGTAALHLCMRSINLKQGDEVITSPFSFIASANCILYEGAKPVFVDIDEKTFNIDPNKIEEKITDKTKAILPVHIFGQPCELKQVTEITQDHNLKIVEDACEAIGAKYNNKKIGTFGNPSVFAFYPNKQITTGEGGMIVTDDKKIYSLCKSLSNQGRKEGDFWLTHEQLGYNYRLNEMSCALGLAQLRKIDTILKKREIIAQEYTKRLKNLNNVITPYTKPNTTRSWFVYVIRLEEGINRDKVINILKENKIETKSYLPPIHLQPLYKKLFGYKGGELPICEEVSNSTLALPFFTQMDKDVVKIVCEELEEAIAQLSR